jgi:hypothetical protein
MISVKQAVEAAEKFTREMFPAADLEYLRLEEVGLSEDEKTRLVTLGWLEQGVSREGSPIFQNPLLLTRPRVYKQFKVDAETGVVKAMGIRRVG